MPKQEFVSNKKTTNCQNLTYGELGQIKSIGPTNGLVITRIYGGFVVLVGNETYQAFETTMFSQYSCEVLVLTDKESVVLTNKAN